MAVPYEYKCKECGSVTTRMMSMEEKHPIWIKCRHCKKLTMKRVLGGAIHIPFQWNEDTMRFDKRPHRKYHSLTDKHNTKK
jgi:putative FmdB family regulatory protein